MTATAKKRPAAKALTKRHGVLIGCKLAFQHHDVEKCLTFAGKHQGTLVYNNSPSPDKARREKAERHAEEALRNPLASALTTRHAAALAEIDWLGGEFFEEFSILTNNGLASGWRDERATDEECESASFVMYPDAWFSLKGKPEQMPRSAIDSLREYARNLQAFARAIERKLQKGEIPTQYVKGFCVVRNGERVSQVRPVAHLAEQDYSALTRTASEAGLEIHAVFADGTSRVFAAVLHAFTH
jgi:hypothetical protein